MNHAQHLPVQSPATLAVDMPTMTMRRSWRLERLHQHENTDTDCGAQQCAEQRNNLRLGEHDSIPHTKYITR